MLSKARSPMTLPAAIHIGFMARIKRSDAIARLRGLIRRQVIAPETAWWFIRAIDDGFAYEIHEGGDGRAYLPGVLERLKAESGCAVHLRAGNRIVRVTAHDGWPRSVILQEESKELLDAIPANARMTRFEPTSSGLLITSGVLLVTAAMTFMATSVAVNSVSDPGQAVEAASRTRDLPVWHWPKAAAQGQYVTRVQLSGGHWTTQVSSGTAALIAPANSASTAARPPVVPGPLAGKRLDGVTR